eukprot:5108011-Heterocapsa_arctica.AAC.1
MKKGRMKRRMRSNLPAAAAGRRTPAAIRNTRGRIRPSPAPSGVAQEGRPGKHHGQKTASQGQEAHVERRRSAEREGKGSGSALGAGAGSRGALERLPQGMVSTGRRPSDHGPREERVRAKGPRAQEESR